jgi:spermidine synthase
MALKRSLKGILDSFKVKHEEVHSGGVKLQVVENRKVRMFKLDGATNSIVNKRSIYTGGYWDYFIPPVYAYRNPMVLIIGLGIGTSVSQLRALFGSRVGIDVVELNEEVIRLAKKYSRGGLNAKIIHGDGYAYVAGTGKKYDVVMLDAYGRGALIPRQFFSRAFVENASRVLRAGGTLAINYAMHPPGILRFIGYRRLLKELFSVYSVNTTPLGDTRIIVCLKGLKKEELLKRIRESMPLNRNTRRLLSRYSEMREL